MGTLPDFNMDEVVYILYFKSHETTQRSLLGKHI